MNKSLRVGGGGSRRRRQDEAVVLLSWESDEIGRDTRRGGDGQDGCFLESGLMNG